MQDEEPFHLDISMKDLEVNENNKTIDQIIMDKDAEIKEVKESLSKANFLVSLLEQENMELKVNQLLLNKPKDYLRKYDLKGKEVVEIGGSDDHEE